MHVASIHSSLSSYRRHSTLAAFENTAQASLGLLPGEKLTRGFRLSWGLRELLEAVQGCADRLRGFWPFFRKGLTIDPVQKFFWQKLELIPDTGEAPLLPIFVEDGNGMNWDEVGHNILQRSPGARFLVFSNGSHHPPVEEKVSRHIDGWVDTRKPWIPLERQIRMHFTEPEPLLYQLRRQRIALFTARERKVYLLRRNGVGDGEIHRTLRLPANRLPIILTSISRKLGVHETEIATFETS